jgi:hypothetical protein
MSRIPFDGRGTLFAMTTMTWKNEAAAKTMTITVVGDFFEHTDHDDPSV